MGKQNLLLGLFVLSILFISGCVNIDYEIVDNQIIAESEVFDLTITPATSHEILTHCHEIEITPDYSEDIDIGGSFEDNIDWVKGFINSDEEIITEVENVDCINWIEEEYEYSCYNNETQTNETCIGYNDVCDEWETTYENVTTYNIGWNEQNLNEFQMEDEHFYMMEEQPVVADELNKFKFCYRERNAGKWNFWAKRSQDDWNVDYILNIDPWWSEDYEWKRALTLNNTEAIDRNNETVVISNLSDYFGTHAQDDYDDIRLIFNYTEGVNNTLGDDLQAYYSFGSITHSSTYPDTDTAFVLGGNGKIDGGYSLDGSSTYVNLGDSDLNLTDFTISAWFKTNVTDEGVIYGKTGYDAGGGEAYSCTDVGGQAGCIMISMAANGYIQLNTINYNGANHAWTQAEEDYSDNGWHHVVGEFNGTNISLYVDGVKKGSNVQSGNFDTSLQTFIGKRGRGNGQDMFFDGLIDEVGIWNRTLTTNEIESLYNNGNGTRLDESDLLDYSFYSDADTHSDLSGNDNHILNPSSGTRRPTLLDNSSGLINSAFDFDETDDYISTNYGFESANNGMTINTWIKTDSLITTREHILGMGATNDADWVVSVLNNKVAVNIRGNGGSPDSGIQNSSSSVDDEEWHMITSIYNNTANEMYIWVDGVLENTYNINLNDDFSMDYDMHIGARNDHGNSDGHFGGTIDEVGFWNKALTNDEIEDLYNSGSGKSFDNFEEVEESYTEVPYEIFGELSYNEFPNSVNNSIELFYRFEQGSGSIISETGDNHGTNVDLQREKHGKFGYGVYTNGNQYMNVADNVIPGYADCNSDFSISWWQYNTGTIDAVEHIWNLAKDCYIQSKHDEPVFNEDGNDMCIGFNDGATWGAVCDADPVLNQWREYIFTYNATSEEAKLYVNGQLDDTTSHDLATKTDGNQRIGDNSDDFEGYFDDFGIYNKVLSDSEINEMYKNNKLRFVTDIPQDSTKDIEIYYGNSESTEPDYSDCNVYDPCTPLWNYTDLIAWYAFDDGTALDYAGGIDGFGVNYGANCSVSSDTGYGTGCLIESYSDRIIIPGDIFGGNDADDPFTIQYLYKFGSTPSDSSGIMMTPDGDNINSGDYRYLSQAASDGEIRYILDYYGSGIDTLTSSDDTEINTWHNIITNFDGIPNNMRLYIDGVYEGIEDFTNNPDAFDSDDGLEFGPTNGRAYDLYLDEVRLWDKYILGTDLPQSALFQTMSEQETVDGVYIDSVTITPSTAYTNNSLNCSVQFNNEVTGETDVTFTWYKNDTNVDTYDTTIEEVPGETSITQYTDTLVTETLTKGDEWICNVYIEDSTTSLENDIENSSVLTISNSAPTFDHEELNWSDYHSVNISLDYNVSDLDVGDNLTYSILNLSGDLNNNLTINSSTGIIIYNPIVNETGFYNYTITVGDGEVNTTQYLEINLTNYRPTIPDEQSPVDAYSIFIDNQELYCNGSTDNDSDIIYYEFWGNKTVDTLGLLQNSTNTTYNWTGLELGTQYTWKCRTHDTLDYSNFTVNRTLNPINFTDCTGNENIVLNFTYENEDNGSAMSATFDANLQLSSDDDVEQEVLFDLESANNHKICLDNGNETVTIESGMIEYVTSGYDARNYYFWDAEIVENATNDIKLYLLSTSLANGISITVEDGSGQALEEHLIYVERYNVETNAYRLIAMGRSGDDGKDTIFLRGGTVNTGDAWYRFKVYYEGELLETTIPQKITSDSLTIAVGVHEWEEHQTAIGDVVSDLSYNETTRTFTNSFSTTTGLSRNVCMKIVEERPGKYLYTKYDECLNSASGTLTYTHNDTEFDYHAYSYTSASAREILEILTIEDLFNEFGSTGIFISALIVILLVMVGTFSPAGAVILGTVGIVISNLFGLLTIGESVIISIISLAIIFLIKLGRSGM